MNKCETFSEALKENKYEWFAEIVWKWRNEHFEEFQMESVSYFLVWTQLYK